MEHIYSKCPKCEKTFPPSHQCPFCGVFFQKIVSRQGPLPGSIPVKVESSSSSGFSKFIFLIPIFILGYFIHKNLNNSKIKSQDRLQALISRSKFSKIKVYGLVGHPHTYKMIDLFAQHGFDTELIPVTGVSSLSAIKNLNQISDRGRNGAEYHVPIVEFENGEVADHFSVEEKLQALPVVNPHPGKIAPYMIVYGVQNCGRTDQVVKLMTSKNIKFEYVDLNQDPKRAGEMEARLLTSQGSNKHGTPYIEVNGLVRTFEDFHELLKGSNL
jgi:glutaredoxin